MLCRERQKQAHESVAAHVSRRPCEVSHIGDELAQEMPNVTALLAIFAHEEVIAQS